MSPNIQMEARLLGLSFLTGAGLMAVYDGLRIFRLMVRHGWLWMGIEDLLYWCFAGFAVFFLLYQENDGALRWYVIGSVLLSMLLYDRLCSVFLLKWLKKAGRCLKMKVLKQKHDRQH
ncbi:MAG: spore cortex biosynthesis protein YabQ [Lachnospiraceae bacterium]|nr:spore cortex biosynthesis protein YabQ [Lachnospiraceae bacterium]